MTTGQKVEVFDKSLLDVMEENNPSDDDTLGTLCSKLSCVTIQMWHNQESLYKIRKMTADEFAEEYELELDELHKTIKRCCDLNFQRSLLMDAIDKHAVSLRGQ